MSTAPRPYISPLCDRGGEGRMRPRRLVADRHHVGVAGKHQMRPVAGAAGVEVLDVGRAVLGEDRPLDREAERLQHRFQRRQRAALGRRDRRAADQRGEVLGGIGRQAHRRRDNPKQGRCHQRYAGFGVARRPMLSIPAFASIIVIFCQILRDRFEPSSSMSLTALDHDVVVDRLGEQRGQLAGDRQHLGTIVEIARQILPVGDAHRRMRRRLEILGTVPPDPWSAGACR